MKKSFLLRRTLIDSLVPTLDCCSQSSDGFNCSHSSDESRICYSLTVNTLYQSFRGVGVGYQWIFKDSPAWALYYVTHLDDVQVDGQTSKVHRTNQESVVGSCHTRQFTSIVQTSTFTFDVHHHRHGEFMKLIWFFFMRRERKRSFHCVVETR